MSQSPVLVGPQSELPLPCSPDAEAETLPPEQDSTMIRALAVIDDGEPEQKRSRVQWLDQLPARAAMDVGEAMAADDVLIGGSGGPQSGASVAPLAAAAPSRDADVARSVLSRMAAEESPSAAPERSPASQLRLDAAEGGFKHQISMIFSKLVFTSCCLARS